MTWLLGLTVAVLLGAGASRAHAEPCVLPAEGELGPLDPTPEASWTPQERWVWTRTLAGEVADFNQLYCEELDPRRSSVGWQNPTKPRQLSERFLLDVLTEKRFTEAVPPRGLRVGGASFPAPLDLSGIEFEYDFWLYRSRFTGPVTLRRARMGGVVLLDGSAFETKLDMEGLEIKRSLFLRGGAAFGSDVILASAKVGSNLETDGSTFGATLRMQDLDVGHGLFLRHRSTFKGDVYLNSAQGLRPA